MPLNPDVKILNAAVGISVDTTTNWTTVNPILLKGQMALDSVTGTIKVGDGVTAYNSLPVRVDATLTQAQRTMLDNVNVANGVVQLDGTGAIPMDLMPAGVVSGAVKFVADIAARDALVDEQKNGLIFVLDASADATVTLGSAQYVWNETGAVWEKVGERESLDLDLTPYFNHETETLDIIADGTNFVKMTPAERTLLAELDTNAVRYTDTVFIEGLGAAQIAAMQS